MKRAPNTFPFDLPNRRGLTLDALIVAPFTMFAASGCSGPAGGPLRACGPGTIESNGLCVAASPNDGGEDSTSTSNGVDASDATVSSSDVAEVSDGQGKSDRTTSQSLDGAPDASEAQSLGNSDPCPDPSQPPLWADCSGQCSIPDSGLGQGACGDGGGSGLLCPTTTVYPFQGIELPDADIVIRTPDQTIPSCARQCPPDGSYAVSTALVFFYPGPNDGTIAVGAPWTISDITTLAGQGPTDLTCHAMAANYSGCTDFGRAFWVVWTTDPNPPARNITIHTTGSCPE